MYLIDSHCHLDLLDTSINLESLWARCRSQGLQSLIIPGTEPSQWSRAKQLSDQLTACFWSAGCHPWFLSSSEMVSKSSPDFEPTLSGTERKDVDIALIEQIAQASLDPKCVAIGECGLDAGKPEFINNLEHQERIFRSHLQAATELKLPLILHGVKTHNKILELINYYQPNAGGVIHGFTGSLELAQQYCRRGFKIGIGGSITYPRASKTRHTAQHIELNHIILETDAPSMPLNGFQGQANTPLQLVNIARHLAELRSDSIEKIATITTANCQQLFKLNEISSGD